MNELDDLEDVRLYDEVRKDDREFILMDKAVKMIEENHRKIKFL